VHPLIAIAHSAAVRKKEGREDGRDLACVGVWSEKEGDRIVMGEEPTRGGWREVEERRSGYFQGHVAAVAGGFAFRER